MVEEDSASRVAAAPYTWPFLTVYDLWVIRLSNQCAWRCDARVMLGLYRDHLGDRHLEVGPGSGWYLANSGRQFDGEMVLMDLNPVPLAYTRRRLEKVGCVVNAVAGSVLDPVPEAAGSRFDSIGLNFVMHCVPGSFAEKGVAFEHLARVLSDDGVLFGSTILGHRSRTVFGRALSAVYTRVGAFNNGRDDREGLEEALGAAFRTFSVAEVGDVTLFTARSPRR
ncbi:class I SAM-dependent methyltransferase [Nocardia carnea]|uniref:class I SAM-dependent methyltransferase n=1 Tax=Nocardia carnea TaxID=37328 RepID=UPI0024567407|nr:class I SAM-dependent methyltransferase [Nocardia carnea]